VIAKTIMHIGNLTWKCTTTQYTYTITLPQTKMRISYTPLNHEIPIVKETNMGENKETKPLHHVNNTQHLHDARKHRQPFESTNVPSKN